MVTPFGGLSPSSPEALEPHVHECLTHLYDYLFLRDQALVAWLIPDMAGANKVQAFRHLIVEAIEQLKLDRQAGSHSRSMRAYNILVLRYVEEQSTLAVMQQLALSERQFYRELRKGISMLSHLLWEHKMSIEPDEMTSDESAFTVQSELQRFQSQTERSQVNLQMLLQGALTATQTLAEQRRISIETTLTSQLPALKADRTMFRQIIILIISHLITHSAENGKLSLVMENAGSLCRISISLTSPAIDAAISEKLTSDETLLHLIEAVEGRLSLTPITSSEAAETLALTLELSIQQPVLLVVDDNPDVVDLLRRYLSTESYCILAAQNGPAAIQKARQLSPDVIILDVMLPGQDGWEILQSIKNHPATQHIPVLVCSILNAPDLAISLGASGYLKKPPGRADFLNLLARCQAQANPRSLQRTAPAQSVGNLSS